MFPAIYVSGKVVVGTHHGEAYAKLTSEQKSLALISGFYDERNHNFVYDDDSKIYLKNIILIRHAESEYNDIISPIGKQQVETIAAFFVRMKMINYSGFCSPLLRCTQTSEIIKQYSNINFTVNSSLSEKRSDENDEMFLQRVEKTIANLPPESILVSHSDFIQKVISLFIPDIPVISNCSVTSIKNNKIIWLARNDVEKLL